MKHLFILLISGILLCLSSNILAIESTRLTDVIKSNGTGNINLLKDSTPLQLEQLRQSNNGVLVFGVDVNEAANGTEKATTQGITVESVQLKINIDDIEYIYTIFSTLTKTLVAKSPSVERNEYYTLLGETGSSRISSSNEIQAIFDSTLSIAVNQNISMANSAVLNIVLLDTNIDMGDPEAFYDYSNGYENMAILNSIDADYINTLRAGHDEAPVLISDNQDQDPSQTVSSWIYYPASGQNYIVAYEDLFPDIGDYDFNDLSVAYHVEYGLNNENMVIRISGEAFLITRGATYNHDWYLRIGLPDHVTGIVNYMNHDYYQVNGTSVDKIFSGNLVLPGFTNTLFNFVDPDYPMVNTFINSSFIKGPRFTFTIRLDSPIEISSIQSAPFDPYLYVHDTGYEIHLINQPATEGSKNTLENREDFQDINGFPFAMILPDNWKPPYAGINIRTAYPEFTEFISSQGINKKNWYINPDVPSVFGITTGEWKW